MAGLAAGVREFGSGGAVGCPSDAPSLSAECGGINHTDRTPKSRPPDDALGVAASGRPRSSAPASRASSAHGGVSRRIEQKSGQLRVVAVGPWVSNRHRAATPASRYGTVTGNGTWYFDRRCEVLVQLPLSRRFNCLADGILLCWQGDFCTLSMYVRGHGKCMRRGRASCHGQRDH